MFRIINHAFVVAFEVGHRLFNDAQVIFECGEQHFLDVQRPCLAEDRTDWRLRIDERFDIGIIFRPSFDAASGAERGDKRILPLYITGTFKEFYILRVGTGPATFYEGNAEFIQFLSDTDFVIARKRKAFRLSSIAEGGVVNLDLWHSSSYLTIDHRPCMVNGPGPMVGFVQTQQSLFRSP